VDIVHECDRRTDGRTDRQTDRITITKTVQCIASHGNTLIGRPYIKFGVKIPKCLGKMSEKLTEDFLTYTVVIKSIKQKGHKVTFS